MSANNSSRRDFIKTGVLGATGIAISSNAASYANILGANDKVRIGIVGFSDRTRSSLIPAFQKYANELNFELVAVSDIWNQRREDGAAYINKLTGKQVAKARNNDELYDMKDVDGVIIGTADFQHALHGVEAVRAGRHAYIEKPLAHSMDDARAILKAVKESKKIVQIGTQRRSGKNYMLAYDFIKSGKFGDIVMAEMTWNVNQPSRWRRPDLVNKIKKEDTDWTRYVMGKTKEDWNPRKYIEYRLFWPYSSGIPDQWMVHQIDTVHWFTGLSRPRSVVANGGIYLWRDGRENFDTMTAVFDYGPFNDPTKGFQVVYSSRMTNGAGGTKEYYFSNGGMINLDTGEVSPEGGLKGPKAGGKNNTLPKMKLSEAVKVETGADTGADDVTSAHVRNWMECIRSGKTPNADVEAGYNHSVALCMTIAALHTGKRITFDDAKQEVVIG
jgi:predicted dehydrogenase